MIIYAGGGLILFAGVACWAFSGKESKPAEPVGSANPSETDTSDVAATVNMMLTYDEIVEHAIRAGTSTPPEAKKRKLQDFKLQTDKLLAPIGDREDVTTLIRTMVPGCHRMFHSREGRTPDDFESEIITHLCVVYVDTFVAKP